jgi:hypothetical protein
MALGRVVVVAVILTAVASCTAAPVPTPSPAVTDTGVVDVLLGIAWPTDSTIVATRPIPASDLHRQELVSIDLGTSRFDSISVRRPPECPSIDAMIAIVLDGRLVFDRYCYPGPATPIAGYHELMELSTNAGAPKSLAFLPWFPDSFVQLPGGAWLSGYDDGLCAWIDVVPGTGEPQFAGPLVISDDGAPYAVNEGLKANCGDNTPLASAITQAPDGALAFLASGASRGIAGFGLLDLTENLYVRDPVGTLRRIGDGLQQAVNLAWNPAGTELIVAATKGGRTGLWRYDRTGHERLVYEGNPYNVTWSPDGTRSAILVPHGDVKDPYVPRRILIVTPEP